jgi:hypothetical protein
VIGEAAQAAYQLWGASAGAVGVGGSGGFEFPSADEMSTVLGMWQDRRTSLSDKRSRIDQALANLTGLAGDQESQGYLQHARDSLNLLKNQHDSMLAYVESYLAKLTSALDAQQATEEDNATAFPGRSGALGDH